MAQRYRAMIMKGPGIPLVMEERPGPELDPGAALLRTRYSEVCGTAVHLHHGRLAGVPYPIIPGHVSIGPIMEKRGRVTDVEGREFDEGDLVTFLDVHETCHQCWYCLVAKQSTRCPRRKVYGITYSASDGLVGGWSEAIWVEPGVHLVRVPRELAPETFIGGGCGLVTALHAVDLAAVRLGETVVILGAGPVGQSAAALAMLSGAGEIIVVGAPADRLIFSRQMGATRTLGLDLPHDDRVAEVRRLSGGRGADVVIEASGAPDAVSQALDLVRDGGRVIVVGQYTDHGDTAINPHRQINRKHLTIRGCWGSDYSHFHRAVSIAARFGDRIPWRDLAARQFQLAQAGEALAAVERREIVKAIITP